MNKNKISEAENFYPEVGQMICDAIPGYFLTAWVHVEMIDDVSSYGVFYLKENNRFQFLYSGLDDIENKFRELRNRFKDADHEAWSGATFILNRDGKFSVDFTYDDVSDFGQASERRDVWIKKYLGENPSIDWE